MERLQIFRDHFSERIECRDWERRIDVVDQVLSRRRPRRADPS
jgi:hypothetical protein